MAQHAATRSNTQPHDGPLTIAEAARGLRVDRTALYKALKRAEQAGHPGRIPYQRGGETVDLIFVRGPFGRWMVTRTSFNAVRG